MVTDKRPVSEVTADGAKFFAACPLLLEPADKGIIFRITAHHRALFDLHGM
jgi:hypothetical protein